MKRLKLLIENFLVYGLGSVISKIIPLIMLPIVTRLMPNTFYYGLNDISNIVISFGSAIAIMGMYDAMFRMFFEKDDINYKKQVCSSTFYFVFFTSIILFSILIIFRKYFSGLFFSSDQYVNLLLISSVTIVLSSLNTIVSAPTRMQNKRKIFLITNALTPMIAYSISIPLLLNKFYVMALPISLLISTVVTFIVFCYLNHKWFSIDKINTKLLKDIFKIGFPLMPNLLIYWVFNSCDRFMIGKILGNEFVGIYGVGARVASISQFIYIAFAGGWQYFAFSTMKNDDQVELISKIYEYLGVISFIATCILTSFSKLIFSILFTGDYIRGSIIFPYMFLSPLLLMLFQTAGNQFLIVKKTWPNFLILSLGAITNIVGNLLLIPMLGIEGAAIGTLLGYIVSNVICGITLSKVKLLKVSKKFMMCCSIMCMYFLLWRLFFINNLVLSSTLCFVIVLIYLVLYKNDLKKLIKGIMSFLKNRKIRR